jgi:VIT1/CCC1 family predicted Fe2+/Mn2+ transporter
MMHRAARHEAHPHPTLLSDFILGSQDGIVNVLGILLGLTAANAGITLTLVAALAAMGAETISMAAVAYTSTLSRRRLYLSELDRERREMEEIPDQEREEVRVVFSEWGYTGSELEDMVDRICRNPRAWEEFMMAFELKLAPVGPLQARNSFLVVGGATLIGSLIPLVSFFVPGIIPETAVIISVVLSAIALALVGLYEARITNGRPFRNAGQMILIGLAAGFAGFLIGHFVGAA